MERVLPSGRQQFFFCLLLGALSVFFAEVTIGSQMFALFRPDGWLLVFPVYWLHCVVLGSLVVHCSRKPSWNLLFLAGALFGMYEAYLTKVIWTGWGDPDETLIIANIAVLHTIILVLFWHAFMAFILPLFLAEKICASSETIETILPSWMRRRLAARPYWICALIAAGLGSIQGLNSPTPVHSILSGLGSAVVLFGLIAWWHKKFSHTRFTLAELLPTGRALRPYVLALILVYVGYGRVMHPDRFPAFFPGQLIVWMMYALLVGLFIIHARRSHAQEPTTAAPADFSFTRQQCLMLALLFTALSAMVSGLLRPLGGAVGLVLFIGGSIYGMRQLYLCIKTAWTGREQAHQP